MEQSKQFFISHDTRDAVLALALKKFLKKTFYNCESFVAGEDIRPGKSHFKEITQELRDSKVIIAIITKDSRDNKWVYFEAGAGVKENKTIPLIAENIAFQKLGAPLNEIQSVYFTTDGITQMVQTISLLLDTDSPIMHDLDDLLATAKNFIALRIEERKEEKKKERIKRTTKLSRLLKKYPYIHTEIEEDRDYKIFARYEITRKRTFDLIHRELLRVLETNELEISEDERAFVVNGSLESIGLNKLFLIAKEYKINIPKNAGFQLTIAKTKMPAHNADRFEKLPAKKALQEANLDLDNYEKKCLKADNL